MAKFTRPILNRDDAREWLDGSTDFNKPTKILFEKLRVRSGDVTYDKLDFICQQAKLRREEDQPVVVPIRSPAARILVGRIGHINHRYFACLFCQSVFEAGYQSFMISEYTSQMAVAREFDGSLRWESKLINSSANNSLYRLRDDDGRGSIVRQGEKKRVQYLSGATSSEFEWLLERIDILTDWLARFERDERGFRRYGDDETESKRA